MPIPRRWRSIAAIIPLLILAFAGGCASPVPGGNGTLSGKRLIVTMTFNGNINPEYYYYFVLNHYGPTGDLNARGPVPVIGPSTPIGGYGNGFATASGGSYTPNSSNNNGAPDYGLTDYVLYNVSATSQNATGLGLYHINNPTDAYQPNAGPTDYQGLPVSYDLSNSNTISFQIDLAKLFPSGTATQTPVQLALALRYIQVNIIATNLVPISQTANPSKLVCAAGDGTGGNNEFTTFVTLDLSKNKTPSLSFNQPQAVIDYNGANVASQYPSLELTNWSYQVTQVSQ